ncbi:MAG: hypothetical protein WAL29_03190 [Bacteroidales bacterium]
MQKILHKAILILAVMLAGCHTGNIKKDLSAGYRFATPDAVIILPAILHEISGLTNFDTSSFACIQDEAGIVFILDLASNRIRRELPFTSKGDFEGIAKTDTSIFVLRSDGALYEISGFESDESTVDKHNTGIPSENNEGLCYDARKNRLLIACKEKVSKGSGSKDERYIYGFDLNSKTLVEEPAYTFDIQDLIDFAEANNVDLPVKTKKKREKVKPDLKFHPSGIGIEPVSNDLYVLSSDDKMLFTFTDSGTIKGIFNLDRALFNQPEGITFLENRDLLISNEGQNRNPTLLRFNYTK